MKLRLNLFSKIVIYAFLIFVGALTLLPLLYTVSASFKTNFEIMRGSINLIPKEFTFDNYIKIWTTGTKTMKKTYTFADYTFNSFKIAILEVVISVVSTAMASYCFQRGRFYGRKLLYAYFLTTMFMAAGSIIMFTTIKITTALHINTWWGICIVGSSGAGASTLFLTMGYLKTIPKELDESAKIDGCTFFSIWWRIILPLSVPILGTLALMKFRSAWNSWMMPNLMLATDQSQTTLNMAIVKLSNSGGSGAGQYNLMMAGTMMSVAPMIIMFLLMNRTFIEGITQGSVKG